MQADVRWRSHQITNLQPPPKKWYKIEGKIEGYRNEAKKILKELSDASPYLSKRLVKKIQGYPEGRSIGVQ
jgi:hypothetical protein